MTASPTEPRPTFKPWTWLVGLIAIAVVAATAGTLTARSRGHSDDSSAAPTTHDPIRVVGAADVRAFRSTVIATLDHDVDAYDGPGGSVVGSVEATWFGRVSALPVIDEQGEWLHVRVAPRPNGSTAWIRRDEVALSMTPYHIEIDLTAKRLRLFERGEVVLDAPAGIGKPETPTVTGEYFVAFFQEAPSPGYGPFVIVTSAHSDTITDWQESGDAVIAIHGPLDTSEEIGTAGAEVSNGCIRLHVDDLAQLRDVPAGTPISIVGSGGGTA